MDSLIKLLGDYEILGVTIYQWALIAGAAAFVLRKAGKAMKMLTAMYKSYQDREDELQEVINSREEIQKELKRLAKVQVENTEKLLRFELEMKKRDKNKLKSELLGYYHLYANRAKNPQHAWTEMEADVFWATFADYENLGGNGFMHSDVQPAMNALEIVKMDDTERIASLYMSRIP